MTFCINKRQLWSFLEFNGFMTFVLTVFGLLGIWGTFCEKIIYDKNNFFGYDIITNCIEVFLHQYLASIIIMFAMIPLLCANLFNTKVNDINNCQLMAIFISFFIGLNLYFTFFYLEAYFQKVDPYPSPFRLENTKYAECGLFKVIPTFSLIIYVKYNELLPTKNAKVAIEESNV